VIFSKRAMANRSKNKFEDLSEAEQEAFRKRLHSGGLLRNMFADFAEEDGPFTSQSRNMYSWEESEEEGPSTSSQAMKRRKMSEFSDR